MSRHILPFARIGALLAAALLSVAASAQEATLFDEPVASQKSRAEVRQEVLAAMARGERLSWGEADPRPLGQGTVSTRTRAAVRAEVLAAIAAGERLSWGEANPDVHRADGRHATRLAKSMTPVAR